LSAYAIDKVCYRVVLDARFREALRADPERALKGVVPPLDDDEIAALVVGDVGTLSRRGASHFLLSQLGRFQLFGLDLPAYAQRIRAAYA
jgi:hypothetical protein